MHCNVSVEMVSVIVDTDYHNWAVFVQCDATEDKSVQYGLSLTFPCLKNPLILKYFKSTNIEMSQMLLKNSPNLQTPTLNIKSACMQTTQARHICFFIQGLKFKSEHFCFLFYCSVLVVAGISKFNMPQIFVINYLSNLSKSS